MENAQLSPDVSRINNRLVASGDWRSCYTRELCLLEWLLSNHCPPPSDNQTKNMGGIPPSQIKLVKNIGNSDGTPPPPADRVVQLSREESPGAGWLSADSGTGRCTLHRGTHRVMSGARLLTLRGHLRNSGFEPKIVTVSASFCPSHGVRAHEAWQRSLGSFREGCAMVWEA